jgi:hypothetical protein
MIEPLSRRSASSTRPNSFFPCRPSRRIEPPRFGNLPVAPAHSSHPDPAHLILLLDQRPTTWILARPMRGPTITIPVTIRLYLLSQAPRSSRRMHGPTITIPVTITTRLYHTRNNPPAAAVAVCAKTSESNSYPAFAVRRRSSMFVAPLVSARQQHSRRCDTS